MPLPEARALLAELDLIPLTGDVVDEAAEVGETLLRSLDAIHLAKRPLDPRGPLSLHRLRPPSGRGRLGRRPRAPPTRHVTNSPARPVLYPFYRGSVSAKRISHFGKMKLFGGISDEF